MVASRWFLPTNTENLSLYFNHGLMTCRKGLGNQYVTDVLENYPPGYLPFFGPSNLSAGLEWSTKEDENLDRCLIELDLKQFDQWVIYTISGDLNDPQTQTTTKHSGSQGEFDLGDADFFLIVAPLPLQCIKQIIVEEAHVKARTAKYFEASFGMDSKLIKVEKKLFKTVFETGDFLGNEAQIDNDLPPNDINYKSLDALGGSLATLFYQTKNGQPLIDFFIQATALSQADDHRNLLELFSYVFQEEYSKGKPTQIFCDIFEILIDQEMDIGQKRFALIDSLKNKEYLFGQAGFSAKVSESLQKINDRKEAYTSPEEVVSRILDSRAEGEFKPETNLLIALVLFFFRDNTETALKFYHEKFTPTDYLYHTVFFGLSFGLGGMPGKLRAYRGLLYFISYHQAQYQHKLIEESGNVFKAAAQPKIILKDLIKSSSDGRFDKFYVWLADYLQIVPDEFISWDLHHKGFVCEGNSPLHFSIRPNLKTVVDTGKFSKALLSSTTGNNKELLDYNKIIDNFMKLSK